MGSPRTSTHLWGCGGGANTEALQFTQTNTVSTETNTSSPTTSDIRFWLRNASCSGRGLGQVLVHTRVPIEELHLPIASLQARRHLKYVLQKSYPAFIRLCGTVKESIVAHRRSSLTALSAELAYLGSSVHGACLRRGRNRIGCLLPFASTREPVRFLAFRQSLHLSGAPRSLGIRSGAGRMI